MTENKNDWNKKEVTLCSHVGLLCTCSVRSTLCAECRLMMLEIIGFACICVRFPNMNTHNCLLVNKSIWIGNGCAVLSQRLRIFLEINFLCRSFAYLRISLSFSYTQTIAQFPTDLFIVLVIVVVADWMLLLKHVQYSPCSTSTHFVTCTHNGFDWLKWRSPKIHYNTIFRVNRNAKGGH